MRTEIKTKLEELALHDDVIYNTMAQITHPYKKESDEDILARSLIILSEIRKHQFDMLMNCSSLSSTIVITKELFDKVGDSYNVYKQ